MNPITTSPQSVYFIGLDLHSTNVFVCIKTAQFGINGMQSQTLVSKKFNVETRPAIEKLLIFATLLREYSTLCSGGVDV